MSSLYDLANACDSSGDNNFSVLVGSHNGKITVPTFNWADYLESYFRRVPKLKLFHHFKLSSKYPQGEVYCYTHLNDPDPVKFKLLKKDVENVSLKLPPIVQPDGLSEERIRYLYNDIREFCSDENKDVTAPAPK